MFNFFKKKKEEQSEISKENMIRIQSLEYLNMSAEDMANEAQKHIDNKYQELSQQQYDYIKLYIFKSAIKGENHCCLCDIPGSDHAKLLPATKLKLESEGFKITMSSDDTYNEADGIRKVSSNCLLYTFYWGGYDN